MQTLVAKKGLGEGPHTSANPPATKVQNSDALDGHTFVMVDNGVGVDVERGVGIHRHAHLSDIRVDLVGLVPAIVKGTVLQEKLDANMR